MTWVWVGVSLAGVLCLAGLIYWQIIVAEGAYLGPRVVAWTYDKVARRYDAIKQFDQREESRYVAEPLLQKLAGIEHPRILDVATGTARLPLALLRGHYAGQIVGLDLSLKMLQVARGKLLPYDDQVGLIWQDAVRLPFEDGAFDAVTSLEALEFFPHPLESLAEMVRVLAPGGVLFLTNRVGREALFLPGHAVRRADLEKALAALGLHEVDLRRWQVSYDLILARNKGRWMPGRSDEAGWQSLLRCPICGGVLDALPAALSCSPCNQSYPAHDGIVHMASACYAA
jgi:ubiquinone/menaquinone biosynthesis C-methylase UbiE